jgi:miniconductance mechanosensitive channel
MLLQFKKHKLIEDFIIEKENDVQKFNSKIIDNGIDSVNNRRIWVQIYAEKYHGWRMIAFNGSSVRSTSKGLPLEIYCFTYEENG